MTRRILIDAGPLVALLNSESEHHEWAAEIWENADVPAITCQAVISEATFILQRARMPTDELFDLLGRGVLKINFDAESCIQDLATLMKRYANVPMSFADACLVRLSELNPRHELLTLDSDFRIYRRHGNKIIPALVPE